MEPSSSPRRHLSSIVRRIVVVGCGILAAGALAAGCGSSDEPEPTSITKVDALRWLPADTWLVATADLSADRIDEAVGTLGRLPIWSLAEGYLPARDGAGLRTALLDQVAARAKGDDNGDKVDAKQLEAAFGNRVGAAIFDDDLTALNGKDAPIAAWIHVDDEQLARDAAVALLGSQGTADEHEGVTYYEVKDQDITYAIRDNLLIATTSPAHMRDLIDVRIDGGSLHDDKQGRAVLDAAIGDAIAGAAIATDPLLRGAGDALEQQAKQLDDPDARARAEQSASLATQVLSAGDAGGLVPDWIAGSVTIDDVGLRMRGAWSNPGELAEPDIGARELAQRMPADAPIVTANAASGDMLRRVQDAWSTVRDETGIDLREAADCRGPAAWACTLAIESALTLLEDDKLADAFEQRGDATTALVQDVSPLLAAAAGGRGAAAARSRILELATPADATLDWLPSGPLLKAMQRAGLVVTPLGGELTSGVRVRVRAASPLGRELRTGIDADTRAALAAFGLTPAMLLRPAGLVIRPQVVDGIAVTGWPASAPSKVVPALRGTADRLEDLQGYRDALAAAKPPEQAGTWAWINVPLIIERTLAVIGTRNSTVRQAIPSVRNNLSGVPGMLAWTSRDEVDGTTVGRAEAVMPILD
ncbi:MAG: hypothetical protein KDC46_07985 [Thermoleophilia bacterium]|nr:hypothetical protein [Thermoleophilia bacterium]